MLNKLEAMAKLVPLFSIIAYGVGFTSFVIYFIKMKAMSKINFFTYMQLSDHIVMFSMGIFMFVVIFFLLSPSLFIYEYVIKEGRTFFKKILYSIGIYFFMCIFIASIGTFSSNTQLFKLSLILFIMNLFVAFLGIFKKSNEQPIGTTIFLIMVFLISAQFFVINPDALIRISGYGNQWACLSLPASEARFIQTNPNLKDIIKYDDTGYGHTNQKVFILLRLRDYVFFSKDKEKAADIEVLSKSEVHIYNVTLTPEGGCGYL